MGNISPNKRVPEIIKKLLGGPKNLVKKVQN